MDAPLTITDPAFWHLPLAERMAALRRAPRGRAVHPPAESENPMTGEPDEFYAVTRYDERGRDQPAARRTSARARAPRRIADMPAEALEFFGVVHHHGRPPPRPPARHRRPARSPPGSWPGVLDSVETHLHRGHRRHVREGRGRPRRGDLAAVPAAGHLRHDGHPPQRVQDRARRHQRDPRRPATPTCSAASDTVTGAVRRRHAAHHADERAGRGPPAPNPTDDLTSALVHNDVGEDMLAPNEIAPFFILLAVAGNDTTRTAISHRHGPAGPEPRPAEDLAGRPRGRHRRPRSRRSCGWRRRSPSCAAPSPSDLTLAGHDFSEGDQLVLFYGAANRDPRVFDDPETLRRPPRPEPPRRLRRPRPPLLPRRPPGPPRAGGRVPPAAHPAARHRGRPATRCRSQAHGHPAGRRHQAPAGAFTPDRAGRRGLSVATPTAWDEQFVHQIPELLTSVASHHPHWRESYFFDIHDPAGEGDVVFFTMAHYPARGSAWTRCRWAGSAASRSLGLHDRPDDGDPHTTEVRRRARRGGRAVGGGPPLGRPGHVRDRPRPHVQGPHAALRAAPRHDAGRRRRGVGPEPHPPVRHATPAPTPPAARPARSTAGSASATTRGASATTAAARCGSGSRSSSTTASSACGTGSSPTAPASTPTAAGPAPTAASRSRWSTSTTTCLARRRRHAGRLRRARRGGRRARRHLHVHAGRRPHHHRRGRGHLRPALRAVPPGRAQPHAGAAPTTAATGTAIYEVTGARHHHFFPDHHGHRHAPELAPVVRHGQFWTVSAPPPPVQVSAPPRPSSTFGPASPTRVSLPEEPVMFSNSLIASVSA